MGIFFLSGILDQDMDPVRRRYYNELAELSKGFLLDPKELHAPVAA